MVQALASGTEISKEAQQFQKDFAFAAGRMTKGLPFNDVVSLKSFVEAVKGGASNAALNLEFVATKGGKKDLTTGFEQQDKDLANNLATALQTRVSESSPGMKIEVEERKGKFYVVASNDSPVSRAQSGDVTRIQGDDEVVGASARPEATDQRIQNMGAKFEACYKAAVAEFMRVVPEEERGKTETRLNNISQAMASMCLRASETGEPATIKSKVVGDLPNIEQFVAKLVESLPPDLKGFEITTDKENGAFKIKKA